MSKANAASLSLSPILTGIPDSMIGLGSVGVVNEALKENLAGDFQLRYHHYRVFCSQLHLPYTGYEDTQVALPIFTSGIFKPLDVSIVRRLTKTSIAF